MKESESLDIFVNEAGPYFEENVFELKLSLDLDSDLKLDLNSLKSDNLYTV